MKKCSVCNVEKNETEYYTIWRNQRQIYYTKKFCKLCANEKNKKYREEKFYEIAEKRRIRKKQIKKRTGVDPVKYKCRYILKNAVDNGKFLKSEICEHCKKKPEKSSEIHAHHIDYSKPFLVIWLCRPCHILEHRRLKNNGGLEPDTNN